VALPLNSPIPDRLLLPGQFVSARYFRLGTRAEGMLCRRRCRYQMSENRGRQFGLSQTREDTVAVRRVKVGEQRDGKWIITGAWKPGRSIIVFWFAGRPS